MGFMDGLIGGVVGAEITSVVKSFVEKQGGVEAIVQQFEQHGLGETVQSWISTETNLPISPAQVERVLGSDKLKQVAEKFGIPEDKIAEKISQYLPQAIDKMTPDGKVPVAEPVA